MADQEAEAVRQNSIKMKRMISDRSGMDVLELIFPLYTKTTTEFACSFDQLNSLRFVSFVAHYSKLCRKVATALFTFLTKLGAILINWSCYGVAGTCY